MTNPAPANLLLVDDTPANLQILASMLRERGYRIRPVTSGEQALKAVEAESPDLVLLDITMPGMDGYEVCRRLKADARWRDVPVLFISALNQAEDKVRAFQAGGVDYVSKPFQFEEVDARVRTHLALRQQQLSLQTSLARQQELERFRDRLTHMAAHDMRSPLLGIQLTFGLLREAAPDDATSHLLDGGLQACGKLVEMINQMLDFSRLKSGKLKLEFQRCDLANLCHEATSPLRPLLGTRRLTIHAPEPVVVQIDAGLIQRVIGNLVGNAIKFSPSTDGEITLRVTQDARGAQLAVTDNGPGIAPEHHALIFDEYSQLDGPARELGYGLGLAFVKMVVDAHGGRIALESVLGSGSTFTLTLPAAPE